MFWPRREVCLESALDIELVENLGINGFVSEVTIFRLVKPQRPPRNDEIVNNTTFLRRRRIRSDDNSEFRYRDTGINADDRNAEPTYVETLIHLRLR